MKHRAPKLELDDYVAPEKTPEQSKERVWVDPETSVTYDTPLYGFSDPRTIYGSDASSNADRMVTRTEFAVGDLTVVIEKEAGDRDLKIRVSVEISESILMAGKKKGVVRVALEPCLREALYRELDKETRKWTFRVEPTVTWSPSFERASATLVMTCRCTYSNVSSGA